MGALCAQAQVGKQAMIVGLDGAGKTSFLYRNVLKQYDQFDPEITLGFNYECVQVYGTQEDEIQSDHYGRAVIFMIDYKDTDRYPEAKNELYKLMNEEELRNTCLCLIVNRKNSEYDEKTSSELEMILLEIQSKLGFDYLPKSIMKQGFILDVNLQNIETINTLNIIKKWLLDSMDTDQ